MAIKVQQCYNKSRNQESEYLGGKDLALVIWPWPQLENYVGMLDFQSTFLGFTLEIFNLPEEKLLQFMLWFSMFFF